MVAPDLLEAVGADGSDRAIGESGPKEGEGTVVALVVFGVHDVVEIDVARLGGSVEFGGDEFGGHSQLRPWQDSQRDTASHRGRSLYAGYRQSHRTPAADLPRGVLRPSEGERRAAADTRSGPAATNSRSKSMT